MSTQGNHEEVGFLELPEKPEVTLENATEAELAMVDQMAAPIIDHFKGERQANKKFNRRNRQAWNKMSTPEKLGKMEKGAEFFMGILGRAGI